MIRSNNGLILPTKRTAGSRRPTRRRGNGKLGTNGAIEEATKEQEQHADGSSDSGWLRWPFRPSPGPIPLGGGGGGGRGATQKVVPKIPSRCKLKYRHGARILCQDKTRILCHTSTRMHTNAHIFKKLGFTTTIQEYFAEHYTRIQNNTKMIPNLLQNPIIKVWRLRPRTLFSGGVYSNEVGVIRPYIEII